MATHVSRKQVKDLRRRKCVLPRPILQARQQGLGSGCGAALRLTRGARFCRIRALSPRIRQLYTAAMKQQFWVVSILSTALGVASGCQKEKPPEPAPA